uniref:ARID DNA-binding domain-containing protein n=1 Tax=Tanacetum cinerariifolium TaxID=118510 RepID=A0A699JTD3_TANCI|nr:ARID DNA-binding domain-containing protein [Tanacetum cinerariifolium]
MDKRNSSYGKWKRPWRYSHGISNKWHQSKILGKPLKRTPKLKFEQRKIKRDEEERIGKCISQKGYIFKSYPAKIKDDAVYKQGHPKENTEGSISVYNTTQAKIIQNKNMGFDIIFKEDKCTLEYMFKDKQGHNMDVDGMRRKHNDYWEEYFESLDKERKDRIEEMPRYVEDINASELRSFNDFVAFLNLIKNDEIVSNGWDIYRKRFDKVLTWFYTNYLKRPLPGSLPPVIFRVPIHLFDLYKLIDCMGGYLNVHFRQEFGALAEILGLTKSDGEEIKKYYMTYLEVFVSYYKTARAPQDPMRGEEDLESHEEYQ